VPGGRGTSGARAAAAALLALLLFATASLGSSAAAEPGDLRRDWIGNFDAPVHVDNAPGFPRLLFVVERRGTIAVLLDEHRLSRPFLDIRDRVSTGAGEQGLLSVAFPPDYKASRRFYVYYTNLNGAIQIDEFKRLPSYPTRADPFSRRKVMVIPHPQFANHNGGQLQFGPDGALYAATGDGGGAHDTRDNARRLGSLLGKLLRINPRRHGDAPYSSPPGNPYVGLPGRDEIYAYGLRNPWRFSFDLPTRTIAIGDVGQGAVEEIDYETLTSAKGANFGWPQWEGDVLHDPARPGPDPAEPPVLTYSHAVCEAVATACAVTGGYVVRDRNLPSLYGRYLYADFYLGDLRSFIPSPTGAIDEQAAGLHIANLSSFGQGVNGRMYAASINGPVFRLTEGD
jgi:glucose/arabinose dehydrogenase